MRYQVACLLLSLAPFASPSVAAEIDLNAGGSVTVDGTLVTCERGQLPVPSFSCAITCTISGFQDSTDVVRPMAASASGSGAALSQVLQSCSDLEAKYLAAFKVQHPTWPIYIDWRATCGGQEAGVRNCCAEDH